MLINENINNEINSVNNQKSENKSRNYTITKVSSHNQRSMTSNKNQ